MDWAVRQRSRWRGIAMPVLLLLCCALAIVLSHPLTVAATGGEFGSSLYRLHRLAAQLQTEEEIEREVAMASDAQMEAELNVGVEADDESLDSALLETSAAATSASTSTSTSALTTDLDNEFQRLPRNAPILNTPPRPSSSVLRFKGHQRHRRPPSPASAFQSLVDAAKRRIRAQRALKKKQQQRQQRASYQRQKTNQKRQQHKKQETSSSVHHHADLAAHAPKHPRSLTQVKSRVHHKSQQEPGGGGGGGGGEDWTAPPVWWSDPGPENTAPWREDPYSYLVQPRGDANTVHGNQMLAYPHRASLAQLSAHATPEVNPLDGRLQRVMNGEMMGHVFGHQLPAAPPMPELDASLQPTNNYPNPPYYGFDYDKEYIWG